ncbi:MAG: hypothetical protein WC052_01150 [Patescibacteria group bacterium]
MPMSSLTKHDEITQQEKKSNALAKPVADFLLALKADTGGGPRAKEGEHAIHVSSVVSQAAQFYERLRYSVDYHEDHLLRRHALERMLRRRFDTGSVESSARSFLVELVHARYLKNDEVPEAIIPYVQEFLDRYAAVLAAAEAAPLKDARAVIHWLHGIAAAELDAFLSPAPEEAALVHLVRATLAQDKPLAAWRLSHEELPTLEFVAAYRALFSLDLPKIRYLLLCRMLPDWKKLSVAEVASVLPELLRLRQRIETAIVHPAGEQLYKVLRQRSLIFHALHDAVRDDISGANSLLLDDHHFTSVVQERCQQYYKAARGRLYSSAVRSTLYIFITKMLAALLLEGPIEAFFYGHVATAPLLINLGFPPLLMLLLAVTTPFPKDSNTEAVLRHLETIRFGGEARILPQLTPPGRSSAVSSGVLSVVYFFVFVATFGAIATGLQRIGFTMISIAFFLFFLSVVSFFVLRVRQPVRDLFVERRREHMLAAVVDLFSLPVLTVGRWISLTSARFNVFLYFFDYFLEAPIKAFLLVTEDVLGFFREKREDIV